MIDSKFISEWEAFAPWSEPYQVEHDLIVSRAIVELFSEPLIAKSLAFRGGTAINKVFFSSPARYSEDIDLVQIESETIGPVANAIRRALSPWLGEPKWKQNHYMMTFYYRYVSEGDRPQQMTLKIETNTREHFSHFDLGTTPYSVKSSWFEGNAVTTTFDLDEIFASKFRALYQRKKGRDLFDLQIGLERQVIDSDRMISACLAQIEHQEETITRALFERNLTLKLRDSEFELDMKRLLPKGQDWDIEIAAERVLDELIPLLPGEPWKGE